MREKKKDGKKGWVGAATETKRGGDAAVDRGDVLFSGAIRSGDAIPLHGTTGSLSGLGGTHGARWTGSRHKDLTLSPPPRNGDKTKSTHPLLVFFYACANAQTLHKAGAVQPAHTRSAGART